MNRRNRLHGLVPVLIALVVIGFDQWTKDWVRDTIPAYTSWNPIVWLEPIVTLTHVHNTGAAFGLAQNMNVVFMVIASAAVIGLAVFGRQVAGTSRVLTAALGLVMGGAAGNLVDRLVQGYVTDFVDVRVWPVFNVADSSVVVGTALLAIYTLFLDREEGETTEQGEAARPASEPASDATLGDVDQ